MENDPCPVCGAPSTRVAELTRCSGVCGLTLATADFTRLSEAVALARALQTIEGRLHEDWEHNELMLKILPTRKRRVVVNDGIYPTLAAALRALAGEAE